MQFTASVPALMAASLVFASLSSAHPAALPAPLPTEIHTGRVSGGNTTTVDQSAPAPALPAYDTKTDDSPYPLASFNVLWWNIKIAPLSIDTWGKYGTCYNLPSPWSNSVGSVGMDRTKTPGCWTYEVKDCAGNNYNVVGEQGIAIYEGGVASFICDAPK